MTAFMLFRELWILPASAKGQHWLQRASSAFQFLHLILPSLSPFSKTVFKHTPDSRSATGVSERVLDFSAATSLLNDDTHDKTKEDCTTKPARGDDDTRMKARFHTKS